MAIRMARTNNYRKRSNRHVLLGMAFVSFSIVCAACIVSQRAGLQPEAAPAATIVAEFDTIDVPVPVSAVAAGARIAEVEFKTIAFPRHQLPPGSLIDLASYQDAVTIASLPANLPLFSENLSLTVHRSNPVIERIPAGMRAITIRVDATSAVEGWAGSGTTVDVLLVEKDRTSVIAEQVQILSAERVVAPIEGSSAPNVPSTITLLVSQEQALAINTAEPRGKIAFALRSLNDSDSWRDKVFTADRLKGRRILKSKSNSVTGYISVKGVNGEQSFALADGTWIKSTVKPQGFLVAEEG